MLGSPHPTLVGIDFDTSFVDVCVWDARELAVTSASHDGSDSDAAAAALRVLASVQPRRPFNLTCTFSTLTNPSELAPLISTSRANGAAGVRLFLPDGTRALPDPDRHVPPAGPVPGALGAVEWARQLGLPRMVAVEQSGSDRNVVLSHPVTQRPCESDWHRPPIEAAVERWYEPGDVDPDLDGQTALAYGRDADAAAAWARACGAERVLVPEHAEAWRAVSLTLLDPVIDFSMDVATAGGGLDASILRGHFAELMEQAAAGVQQACYEQDDAALYRHAVIDPDGAAPIRVSMESATDFDSLADKLRDHPAATLRLTTRTVIAAIKPSIACLVDRERS